MMIVAFSSAILFTWAVCGLTLIGTGSLILSPFGSDHSILSAFWVGLGGVVAGLEIYSITRPVDWIAPAFIALVGLLGLLANHQWFFGRLRSALGERSIAVWTCAVVAIAMRAAGPCEHYDTGLYGAAAVRWIESYRAVPGLANLHVRLGFNSSVFLCIAAMERGPWEAQAHHLFVGLLISALLAVCIPAMHRLFSGQTSSASDWFCAILLVPAGAWAVSGTIVGTNTDIPTAVVALASAVYLMRELERDRRGTANGVIASVLLSVAVCFKLSAIVFAVLAWTVLNVAVWYSSIQGRRKGNIIGCVAAPMLILTPWIVRGVLLSGYPFFPAPVFGSSASWRVSVNTARFWIAAMKAWAQTRTMTVQQGWPRLWLAKVASNRLDFQLPIILTVCGLGALFKNAEKAGRMLWILAPAAAGILFWFLAEPDPRFGEFEIWTLAGALAAFTAVSLQDRDSLRTRRITILVIVMLAWYVIGLRRPWYAYRPLVQLRHLPGLPHARLITRQTASGLTVYLPTKGEYQCWNAPLPCTPYFDERLRLIRPPELNSGFVSDGKIACKGVDCSAH